MLSPFTMCLLPYYTDPAPQGQAGCFPGYPKSCVGFLFSSPIGQRHWDYYAALARFMAGIDDLEDTARADINGDGILSAADLTALARMLEAQQGTQTADADENGAPVDTGAELNADAQDTVQTEDGGAPVEPAPVVDDVPETVEESVTGEVPQTEAGEQAA